MGCADERPALIALVFRYDARDHEEFERSYGADGEWAQFFPIHGDEYLRRSDETRISYLQELRMGTFENI